MPGNARERRGARDVCRPVAIQGKFRQFPEET